MRQLPLPMRLRASSVFDGFLVGPNNDAVQLLQRMQFGVSPAVYLYGPHGVGKTHLLQALCAQATTQQLTVSYWSLPQLIEYGPEILQGSERLALLCIDDVGDVLGKAEWNRVLFSAYRELEEHQGKLILTAEQPPAAYSFALPDLASRIMAGTVLRLQPLNDTEQLVALQLHASRRGLELPEETALFLLRRLPRDMSTLCIFLDELDTASLAAQRKLTVPFVKQVLDASIGLK